VSIAILASVSAAGLYGLGSVLQSVGASSDRSPDHRLASVFRQLPYMAGLGCDLIGWLLAMYAVKHLPLFAVHTTLAGSVAVTVVLARFILHSTVRQIDAAAIGAVVIGLVLVGISAGPTPDDAGGRHVHAVLYVAAPCAVVLGIYAVRDRRPIIASTVAGLMFSLGATAIRSVMIGPTFADLIAQPLVWVAAAFLAGGLVVHADALREGEVGPVTAVLWATEVITAATAGLVLFGDRVRPGHLWVAALGMVLGIGATILLALSPSHSTAAHGASTGE
jgi:drug/metabolite transporter (DMT)-like permease